MTDSGILGKLNSIPKYKDNGSNFNDFEEAVNSTLILLELEDTLSQGSEPLAPEPPTPANGVQAAEHELALHGYAIAKAAYDKELAAWTRRQLKATTIIITRCETNNRTKLLGCNRAYLAMDILSRARATGQGRYTELSRRIFNLKLADCTDIADFSAQLTKYNHELKAITPRAGWDSLHITQFFLEGLGSAYDAFRSTFEQTHHLLPKDGIPEVSFEDTVQEAYNEEARQANSMSSQALVATASGHNHSGDFCTHCKKPRHTEAKCWKKYPHLKAEHEAAKASCKKRKHRGDDKKDSKRQRKPSLAPDSGEVEEVNCVAISQALPDPSSTALVVPPIRALQNDWIVDTGCTNHATGNRSHFVDLNTTGDFGVCGGVGGSVKFEGIGTVQIPIPGADGKLTVMKLSGVKYCPGMGAFNLISVSQIIKKGLRPSMTQDSISWVVVGSSHRTTVKASLKNGLFLLNRAS